MLEQQIQRQDWVYKNSSGEMLVYACVGNCGFQSCLAFKIPYTMACPCLLHSNREKLISLRRIANSSESKRGSMKAQQDCHQYICQCKVTLNTTWSDYHLHTVVSHSPRLKEKHGRLKTNHRALATISILVGHLVSWPSKANSADCLSMLLQPTGVLARSLQLPKQSHCHLHSDASSAVHWHRS
jgi:hypothetical protein